MDEKEWIVLNEIMNSPFFTGSFNGKEELVEVSPNEFLLSPTFSAKSFSSKSSSSSSKRFKGELTDEELDDILGKKEQQQKIYPETSFYSVGFKSLILTPEFLISLGVFSQNMNWISKEVAIKCIQSSQNTTSKIKSITQIIRNQCNVIPGLTSTTNSQSFNDCEVNF
ncbi:hypothetical protein RB653_009775 [Dictyostelium firmibasis]|uniref:Uncharacterized protein n=1 Tax=Dictyostelium firmibasis TaxID=79012 RepID=A0AAN7YT71_9MYCE